MEILFKGFIGSGSDLALGWFMIALGAALCLGAIFSFIQGYEGSIGIILIGVLIIIFGFVLKADNRIPIIKATINESVSWQEINDKYKLREQTGKIYTFEVKDTTIEEWESLIKEENK